MSSPSELVTIEWTMPGGRLGAMEPRVDEVARHAKVLAAGYNDSRNAALLGHSEVISEADVLEHYAKLLESNAHPFMFFREGELVGDGDLRGITGGVAEFAFLIVTPSEQGKGLGTRFATMLHTYAFGALGLDLVFASVLPENVASRRAFEKLGYSVFEGESAQAYYTDPGDIMLAIDRDTFTTRHAAAMAEIQISMR